MLQLFQNHRVNRTRIELCACCELPGLDGGKMMAASTWPDKAGQLYFQNYLNTLTLAEHQIVERLLPAATDWFIQAGSTSMSATAADIEWRLAA